MSARLLLVVVIVAAGMGSLAWAQRESGTDRPGDPLPEGVFARMGTLRFRGAAAPLAFSPDGKVLASAATDWWAGAVVLWEASTGRSLHRLRPDRFYGASSLSFTPDGKWLALSEYGEGIVVEVPTGRKVYSFRGGHGVFADDGKLLFSADPSGDRPRVRVWDAATGKPRGSWTLKERPEAFCVSTDGRTCALVDCGSPKVVRIHDAATGKERPPATVGKRPQDRIALSPDGKTLVIAGRDGVLLWDVATGKETRRWEQRADSAPVFAADGKRVAWMGYDEELGIARAWTALVGDERPHAVGDPTNVFEAPALSPDGKVLAVPTDGRVIVLRDVVTGKDLRPFDAHASRVGELELAGDGHTLVSGDRLEVLAWDWPSGRLLRRFPTERPSADSALRILAGGRVLCRGAGGTVHVRDGRTGRETLRLEGKHGSVWVAVSADGSSAALVGEDRRLRVFDLRTGKARCSLEAGNNPFGLSLSPDGRFLFWYFDEGKQARLLMTDTRTGRPGAPARAAHLPGLPDLSQVHGASPTARLISPDGRWLVVPDTRNRLRRWDVRAGKELEPLHGAQSNPFGVYYSPDSRFVSIQGNSGRPGVIENTPGPGRRTTLRVWEIASGRLLKHLDPNPATGERILFSAEGRTLFTTNAGTIYSWEVLTGRERGRLEGHLGTEVSSLLLTPDGRTLFSGGDDAQVLAWDLTGRRGAEKANTEQVRKAWDALADTNARAAYRAAWALASNPEQTLPLLRRQLRPVPTAKPDHVARLLADLDSNRFAVRRRAADELEELGEPVAPALRKALGQAAGLESRRRIEQVLDEIERPVPSGRRLQALRALEVLEMIHTTAAREFLTALATGAAGARLTSEARLSRERLGELDP